MDHEMNVAATKDLREAAPSDAPRVSVVTRMTFDAPPPEVWRGLMFYEELGGRPPLHLRLLLPVPIRTEGKISEVGDEALCLYEGGHLLKRLTRIERGDLSRIEVAEQALSVGQGGALLGWTLHLDPAPRRPNRSLGGNTIPQYQVATLVLEADRANGLPSVPSLPLEPRCAARSKRGKVTRCPS